jgi:hypothetical protein
LQAVFAGSERGWSPRTEKKTVPAVMRGSPRPLEFQKKEEKGMSLLKNQMEGRK